MSKVLNIRNGEERLEIASEWIVRMDQGLSASEKLELKAWMADDPKNAKRLLSMAKRWDKMHNLSRLAELFPEPGLERRAPQRQTAWAVAAATCFAAIAAALLWFTLDEIREEAGSSRIVQTDVSSETHETAVGEQSTITLSDGTVVVLNTNTLIRLTYSPRARVIKLTRGEIHVEVAEDPSRPFSVVAGDRILQAVGTSFSVEITDEQHIELVVTEGMVVVGLHAPGTASPAIPVLTQAPDNAVTAGQEVVLGGPDETVTVVSPEDIEVKLSWREGRLIFRGEPLEDALSEVERYTTVKFVFVDETLRTKSVTGRFRAGDVDTLLIALRMNFDIDHERTEDGRVLLSSL